MTPTPVTASDDRARNATTTFILVVLLLGLGTLAAGLARGVPTAARVVALADLPSGLARADGAALVSAGVLLMLLASLARLLGLVAQFWQARDRAALSACAATLALLVLSFVLAR